MHGRGFEYVHETTGPNSCTDTASYLTDEWQRRGLWQLVQQDYEDRRRAKRQGTETVRPSVVSVEDHLDSYIATQAVRYVESYEDARPLCLFVGFGGPHDPWDAPGEYATMYLPEEAPAPTSVLSVETDAPEWVRRNMAVRRHSAPPALVSQIRANYYGKISLIDHQIGRILDAFEGKGWLAELLIVFLSDHGEMLGDHGRLAKGTFHEPAVRVPLLMRWPGHIAGNSVTEALVENIDVFPTLLEAAGAPSTQSMGRSLWAVLRQPTVELKDSQLGEFEGKGSAGKHVMLRTRRYKFAIDGQARGYMLYDLEQDPYEQSNLAGRADAADLENELRGKLDKRFAEASVRVGMERGFTLIEVTIALVLLALMASVLYGSLSLAGTSWDRGELKAQQTAEMRLTEDFLRRTLTSQHPLRLQKVVEKPLYFVGASDSLSYAVALPGRAGAGMYFFKIALTPNGNTSRLTLARMIPDYAATSPPDFGNADVSILADGVVEARFGYFGRDPGAADVVTPTWRDRWDDQQRLPDLIRLDVKLANGTSWPPLIVEPRLSMQVGCMGWNPAARRCT
jgi:prepilin-type N-terminal cleavage/methylation domain-containing protein